MAALRGTRVSARTCTRSYRELFSSYSLSNNPESSPSSVTSGLLGIRSTVKSPSLHMRLTAGSRFPRLSFRLFTNGRAIKNGLPPISTTGGVRTYSSPANITQDSTDLVSTPGDVSIELTSSQLPYVGECINVSAKQEDFEIPSYFLVDDFFPHLKAGLFTSYYPHHIIGNLIEYITVTSGLPYYG